MVTAKVFIFKKQFEGYPKPTDFELKEENLPPIKDGEFLAEAVYLSVDPYMRAYAKNLSLSTVFIGQQVAKITESKHVQYPVGKYILGSFGWRTHTISNGKEKNPPTVLPDMGDLPVSLGIGILGMIGCSAYFGFLEICKPQEGETVVISGAAGAVGSLVGQIAKIKGCKVIGITGSDEKGNWLVHELGFDDCINYKSDNVNEKLSTVAPQGVDCYFDNVGGALSATVLNHMNQRGRISVCGAISAYNEENSKSPIIQFPLVFRELRMEGFMVARWKNRSSECFQQHLKWIKEGKLKYHETVTEGFENMAEAFISMLKGGNIGKAVVKA